MVLSEWPHGQNLNTALKLDCFISSLSKLQATSQQAAGPFSHPNRFCDDARSRYTPISFIGEKLLAGAWKRDSSWGDDSRSFLDPAIRADLIALVRDGKAETCLTRRANALLLLDDGMSCEAIAKVLHLDDDTIRYWYKLVWRKRPELAGRFRLQGPRLRTDGGAAGRVEKLGVENAAADHHHSGEVDRKVLWRELHRSALIKLLQRIEVECCKPKLIPRKLDPAQQQAFIANYENLLNNLGDDEAVLFADAVHPTHEARPAGCWAPKDAKVALEQTSGRQRLNIHGAIDLETGATRMIEATTIDALSTIALLMAITLMYPTKRLIPVFVDNARYHHALLVQEWLARPGCRIGFIIPSYCPHL